MLVQEYQVAGQVHGQQKLFRKPLFATFVMFVGMSGCAVVYILQSLFSLLERHGFIKKVLGSLSSTMRYLFASGPIAAGGSVERSIPSEDDCIADCGSNPGEFDTSTGAPQSSVKQTFQANARSLIWNQSSKIGECASSIAQPLLDYNKQESQQRIAGSENGFSTFQGQNQEPVQFSKCNKWILLCIPMLFDMLATVLMCIGLLHITVSCYQMMRAAELFFAAIFSVSFLGKHLNRLHLSGIALSIVGIFCVAVSNMLGEAPEGSVGTPAQQLFGIMLVVVSQAIQAAQLTFEEHFLNDLNIPPMLVVGMEGVYGVLVAVFVLLPVAYLLPGNDAGSFENTLDSLELIASSHEVQGVLLLAAVCSCAYNLTGMHVTSHLGAVFRSLLETTRTLFAWLVDLLFWYTPIASGIHGEIAGENWHRFSWLQALGFLILVGGTLTFNVGDERLHKERMNSNQHQERDINVIQQDTILSHAQTDPVIVPIASNSGMALPYMGGPTQRPSLLCTASLIPTPSSIPTVHASESHLSASRISMYYNSIGSSITSSY
mmetsp:Transcript_25261/g.47938  ORF Transcript_25261/g.47938 Transcript_25261/m.47938 type:complete len:547 (-) Transcript_25261:155-1795(-)